MTKLDLKIGPLVTKALNANGRDIVVRRYLSRQVDPIASVITVGPPTDTVVKGSPLYRASIKMRSTQLTQDYACAVVISNPGFNITTTMSVVVDGKEYLIKEVVSYSSGESTVAYELGLEGAA
jgi:hypothetical protein